MTEKRTNLVKYYGYQFENDVDWCEIISSMKDTDTDTPPPGSDAAIDMDCSCPVLDNNYGRGAYKGEEGEYIIAFDCPLHGDE